MPIMHISTLFFDSIKKVNYRKFHQISGSLFAFKYFRMQYKNIERDTNVTLMYLLINPTLMHLYIVDMYSVSRALVTKHHKLENLKQQEFFSCSSGGWKWKPKVLAVLIPTTGSENLVHASLSHSGGSQQSRVPRLVEHHSNVRLYLHLHSVFSPCSSLLLL